MRAAKARAVKALPARNAGPARTTDFVIFPFLPAKDSAGGQRRISRGLIREGRTPNRRASLVARRLQGRTYFS